MIIRWDFLNTLTIKKIQRFDAGFIVYSQDLLSNVKIFNIVKFGAEFHNDTVIITKRFVSFLKDVNSSESRSEYPKYLFHMSLYRPAFSTLPINLQSGKYTEEFTNITIYKKTLDTKP